MCLKWCKKWLVKEYGAYRRQYMAEAMIAFQKPIKCRFFEICGNELNRLTKKGKLRHFDICSECKPIWKAGFEAGRYRRDRIRKGKHGGTYHFE
jgi:hypothetical protein